MMLITERRSPFYPNIQNVPPSVIRKLVKNKEIQLIDIRQPWEYEDHHIPGSILLPLDYFEDLFQLMLNKSNIGIICEHANRSTWLVYTKPSLFKEVKVYNMLGGIELWMMMGYEVEKGMDDNGTLWYKLLTKNLR
ncbi:Rhodanese domain protein [Sulfolobus islandicus Y.G.57.14]|jgi:rhodanese-related sulfurtransferase|uniref:Rhodanese domain protein n=5 Tax=Saccharolobus islandicus TaxID=43080 RepID=C3MMQ7_SACI2|nr:rhodanese-like domain-containing protein [Sulfolobus islandicus]ACP36774.1 Rhodanese domain protein [Sulfolobus islandicus L.S.2.15]ACP47072.1 Rhodanese domain protein [Sulfolobus islandicus Y.G.57.14]ACP49927.1 Rhodanese domain protein [Sulfolobus islandicus Y.N.15.51]ACR43254.1 Rhodanese domain protein [Sulfolobus islandicus M.16.4]ADB88590.1 Rhodanese domain protein [Sulfolobus islandicus L.D.8.5]